MDVPWPAGDAYDHQHQEAHGFVGNLGVAWDSDRDDATRLLVQLRNATEVVAQMDHDPTTPNGHDLRTEGLHVDVYRRDGSYVHVELPERPLPTDDGALIRLCQQYLYDHREYFRAVHDGERAPDDPPTP
jgi:hypothetical protein